MLIVFGGLPGTGKTTLAKALATKFAAVYLRIDTIEQAIRSSAGLPGDIGAVGYVTAYRLAEENLRLGRTVVADSVNPLRITRDSWAETARNAGAAIIEVEVICSDLAEHRRRVESRLPDIDGMSPVTWTNVVERRYETWSAPHIVIDTARKTISESEEELIQCLAVPGRLSR